VSNVVALVKLKRRERSLVKGNDTILDDHSPVDTPCSQGREELIRDSGLFAECQRWAPLLEKAATVHVLKDLARIRSHQLVRLIQSLAGWTNLVGSCTADSSEPLVWIPGWVLLNALLGRAAEISSFFTATDSALLVGAVGQWREELTHRTRADKMTPSDWAELTGSEISLMKFGSIRRSVIDQGIESQLTPQELTVLFIGYSKLFRCQRRVLGAGKLEADTNTSSWKRVLVSEFQVWSLVERLRNQHKAFSAYEVTKLCEALRVMGEVEALTILLKGIGPSLSARLDSLTDFQLMELGLCYAAVSNCASREDEGEEQDPSGSPAIPAHHRRLQEGREQLLGQLHSRIPKMEIVKLSPIQISLAILSSFLEGNRGSGRQLWQEWTGNSSGRQSESHSKAVDRIRARLHEVGIQLGDGSATSDSTHGLGSVFKTLLVDGKWEGTIPPSCLEAVFWERTRLSPTLLTHCTSTALEYGSLHWGYATQLMITLHATGYFAELGQLVTHLCCEEGDGGRQGAGEAFRSLSMDWERNHEELLSFLSLMTNLYFRHGEPDGKYWIEAVWKHVEPQHLSKQRNRDPHSLSKRYGRGPIGEGLVRDILRILKEQSETALVDEQVQSILFRILNDDIPNSLRGVAFDPDLLYWVLVKSLPLKMLSLFSWEGLCRMLSTHLRKDRLSIHWLLCFHLLLSPIRPGVRNEEEALTSLQKLLSWKLLNLLEAVESGKPLPDSKGSTLTEGDALIIARSTSPHALRFAKALLQSKFSTPTEGKPTAPKLATDERPTPTLPANSSRFQRRASKQEPPSSPPHTSPGKSSRDCIVEKLLSADRMRVVHQALVESGDLLRLDPCAVFNAVPMKHWTRLRLSDPLLYSKCVDLFAAFAPHHLSQEKQNSAARYRAVSLGMRLVHRGSRPTLNPNSNSIAAATATSSNPDGEVAKLIDLLALLTSRSVLAAAADSMPQHDNDRTFMKLQSEEIGLLTLEWNRCRRGESSPAWDSVGSLLRWDGTLERFCKVLSASNLHSCLAMLTAVADRPVDDDAAVGTSVTQACVHKIVGRLDALLSDAVGAQVLFEIPVTIARMKDLRDDPDTRHLLARALVMRCRLHKEGEAVLTEEEIQQLGNCCRLHHLDFPLTQTHAG
jgi:hypothetical protein